MKGSLERRSLAFGCVALALVIFTLDILVEPFVFAPLAYVALILLSGTSTRPYVTVWLATLVTALVTADYLVVSPNFLSPDLAYRGFALLVIWWTALVIGERGRITQRRELALLGRHGQADAEVQPETQAERALRVERRGRLRLQEELEETAQLYQAVFDQTFQLAAVLRASGMTEKVNATMCAVGSFRAQDVVGTPIWELPVWDVETRDTLQVAVQAAASGDFFRSQFAITRSSGDEMVVDLSLKPIRNTAGHVDLILLEARDITQHLHDQTLLMQAQKMEVLGQFASGIAHDFNNLLTVISANLELVEKQLEGHGSALKRIRKSVNAVFQGRALTDQILTFARKRELEPRSIDVTELVAEAIELSRSGMDENISIESDVSPGLWPCWADAVQLQTSVLNLVINARDAMPNGGRIAVRAVNYQSQPVGKERGPRLPGGDYVLLTVIDEGEGIPAENLEKVTDAFFTTKQGGAGTGLGLSMAAGFARQSGGDLTILSDTGQGTTVNLYLPRSRAPVTPPEAGPKRAVSGGRGRLLVVEDDGDVRDTVVSMLVDLGHQVEEASNSEEALAILRGGRRFDLLLTDIVMPQGQDGATLGREARSLSPDLKLLYSSGNPEKIAELRATQSACEDFIPKPYHYDELAQKVEGLLSREGTSV